LSFSLLLSGALHHLCVKSQYVTWKLNESTVESGTSFLYPQLEFAFKSVHHKDKSEILYFVPDKGICGIFYSLYRFEELVYFVPLSSAFAFNTNLFFNLCHFSSFAPHYFPFKLKQLFFGDLLSF